VGAGEKWIGGPIARILRLGGPGVREEKDAARWGFLSVQGCVDHDGAAEEWLGGGHGEVGEAVPGDG